MADQSESKKAGATVERRVRFALVTWLAHDDRLDRGIVQSALRDQVISLPEQEAARLDEMGATVPADVELSRVGALPGLPENATDEQIIGYVRAASPSELRALYAERPDLGLRIDGARRRVFDSAAEADRALQRAQEVRDGDEVSDTLGPDEYDDIVLRRPEVRPPASTAPDVRSSQGGSQDPEAIVAGTAEEVADYVSQHPDQASAVLDAENRRREGHPRQMVVRAVEAAAAHTAQ